MSSRSSRMFTVICALAAVATSVWYTDVVEGQRIVTDGLISFWTFDRSDIEDETVKDVWDKNDGIIEGDPQIVGGKIEEALEFDGTGDYVDLGKAKDFDLPVVTVECWFKTSSSEEMRIFAPGATYANKWFLTMPDPNGNINLSIASAGNQNQQTTDSFNNGQWHHVVGITDPKVSNIKIYVDGVLERSSTTSEDWSFDGNAKIGAKSAAEFLFNGIIDEVRIYNRALSEDEVQQNYKATSQLIAVEPVNKLAITWGRIKAKG